MNDFSKAIGVADRHVQPSRLEALRLEAGASAGAGPLGPVCGYHGGAGASHAGCSR